MIIIVVGLFLNNFKKSEKHKNEKKYVIILLFACFFNALSAMCDKIVTQTVTATELQWWFMFFLVVLYWLYFLSLGFIVSDRLLFMANSDPNSQLTVMALIKQLAPVVMIVIGGKIFKEKNLEYKLFCAIIIIIGITFVVI